MKSTIVSQVKDRDVEDDWSSSDTLLLEGLSGLENSFRDDPRGAALPVRNKEEVKVAIRNEARHPVVGDRSGFTLASPPVGPLPSAIFRTAREMRAAQERFAAKRRSAARRGDGTTGRVEDVNGPIVSATNGKSSQEPKVAQMVRPMAPAASLGIPRSTPRPLEVKTKSEQTPLSPSQKSASPIMKRIGVKPQKEKKSFLPPKRDEKSVAAANDFQSRVPEAVPRPRVVDPTMGDFGSYPTITREKGSSREGISLFPAVLTSLLLSCLVLLALFFGLWTSFGKQWLEGLVSLRVDEANKGLRAEYVSQDELQELRGSQTILEGRHETWVRMHTLEAEIYTSNSRERFDELVSLGSLVTGREKDYLKLTKERIEQAYIKRLGQHPGLAVSRLLKGSRAKNERDLEASDLLDIVRRPDVSEWDRARAAWLLRQFKGNVDVETTLLDIVRDGSDLQMVFAAWDSLLAMTGYEAKAGFDVEQFFLWWNLNRAEPSAAQKPPSNA